MLREGLPVTPSFRFVQFEFPWALGPTDGRYVVRAPGEETAEHVLVLGTVDARPRRRTRRRRARPVEPEPEPTQVPIARATVIDADPLASEEAAVAWLAAGRRPDEAEDRLSAAVLVLNRALAAHRLAAADPTLRDVVRDQAVMVRIGYGAGDEVADGNWSEAIEVPPSNDRRGRRAAVLRPQERLAALLGGRDEPLACEELALRARIDLDRDAPREAALQLRVALEAALAELEPYRDVADLGERIDELGELRGDVGRAANAAIAGPVDADTVEAVERITGRLEAALRARAAAGPSA